MYAQIEDLLEGDQIVIENARVEVTSIYRDSYDITRYNRENNPIVGRVFSIEFQYLNENDCYTRHHGEYYNGQINGMMSGRKEFFQTKNSKLIRVLPTKNERSEHRSVLEEIAVELDKRMSG